MITFLSIYNMGEKCNYCEQKKMLIASKKHSKFLLISERIDPDLNHGPWAKLYGKGCVNPRGSPEGVLTPGTD